MMVMACPLLLVVNVVLEVERCQNRNHDLVMSCACADTSSLKPSTQYHEQMSLSLQCCYVTYVCMIVEFWSNSQIC